MECPYWCISSPRLQIEDAVTIYLVPFLLLHDINIFKRPKQIIYTTLFIELPNRRFQAKTDFKRFYTQPFV